MAQLDNIIITVLQTNERTNKNAEEWMGHFRIKAMNVNIKKKIEDWKKQFIDGINKDNVMTEIIWQLTAVKKTCKISSEQVLAWARGVEVQRTQKVIIKVSKDKRYQCCEKSWTKE